MNFGRIGIGFGRLGAQTGAATFTGILDRLSVAPVAAHSDRRLTGVSWGTDDGVLDPMRRIWRASDSAEMNFSYDASTNVLDYAAIVAWLGGSAGRVIKWFDHTGDGNYWEQTTPASAPFFLNNAGVDFRRATGTWMRQSNATLTTDWGFEFFGRATIASEEEDNTIASLILPDQSLTPYSAALVANLASARDVAALSRSGNTSSSSTLSTAFTGGTEAVFSGQWPTGSSRTARVDGTSGTTNTDARLFQSSARWYLGRLNASTVQLYLNAPVRETFIFHTPPSSADRLALEAAW